MELKIFNPMEIDAIGEIMNISLGSSATAVSNLLDHRVDITTPRVSVLEAKDLTLGNLDPAVGVEIQYVSGLIGSNFMLLKREDVKTIVDILMGYEMPEEEFELNELTISAVCEVMNQMMGAASTALSDFLGRMVNISTPKSFELDNFDEFKREHFPDAMGALVVVRFMLSIEGFMQSEFVNVISIDLARELISGFGLDDSVFESAPPDPMDDSSSPLSESEIQSLLGGAPFPAPTPQASENSTMSQEDIEKLLSGGSAFAPPAAEPAPAPAGGGGMMSQEEIEKLLSGGAAAAPAPAAAAPMAAPAAAVPTAPPAAPPGYPPPYPPAGHPPVGYPPQGYEGMQPPAYYPPPGYYYPPMPEPREPAPQKLIATQNVAYTALDPESNLSDDQAKNFDLVMSVSLEVSVEIGRTQRKVQDILTFSKGSLVVLDRLAGDQVDLFVNGHCIAKGDVVVVDDNFGIRITEILNPPSPNDILQAR